MFMRKISLKCPTDKTFLHSAKLRKNGVYCVYIIYFIYFLATGEDPILSGMCTCTVQESFEIWNPWLSLNLGVTSQEVSETQAFKCGGVSFPHFSVPMVLFYSFL